MFENPELLEMVGIEKLQLLEIEKAFGNHMLVSFALVVYFVVQYCALYHLSFLTKKSQ